jgi:hypothetical protein
VVRCSAQRATQAKNTSVLPAITANNEAGNGPLPMLDPEDDKIHSQFMELLSSLLHGSLDISMYKDRVWALLGALT